MTRTLLYFPMIRCPNCYREFAVVKSTGLIRRHQPCFSKQLKPQEQSYRINTTEPYTLALAKEANKGSNKKRKLERKEDATRAKNEAAKKLAAAKEEAAKLAVAKNEAAKKMTAAKEEAAKLARAAERAQLEKQFLYPYETAKRLKRTLGDSTHIYWLDGNCNFYDINTDTPYANEERYNVALSSFKTMKSDYGYT